MLIFGNTPNDLKQMVMNNKRYFIIFAIGFVFGLLI